MVWKTTEQYLKLKIKKTWNVYDIQNSILKDSSEIILKFPFLE